MRVSTLNTADDSSISAPLGDASILFLEKLITARWQKSDRADLVVALKEHPALLRNRSVLLNLAIEEYRINSRTSNSSDLDQYCDRFLEFGTTVRQSIFRQLEAKRYFDTCPDFLNSTPTWPKVGDRFGDFLIQEELGVGSAAHVYLCLQADVGFRQVVVKATPYSSFEASILGRLNHPNITSIYSTGYVDDFNLNYLCMPFCGRSTLNDLLEVAFEDGCPFGTECVAISARRWMQDEELSLLNSLAISPIILSSTYVDAVLLLAIQIADALISAHHLGILHGDLKPSNILLTPDARPILLDFNLSQDFVRSPGICGGTLPYMPPEYLYVVAQRSEKPSDSHFSPAPDIYSFGALLYELLTGMPPVTFSEGTGDACAIADQMLTSLERGINGIRAYNPLVSGELESVILQCLELNPDQRYASLAELTTRLRNHLRPFARFRRVARMKSRSLACKCRNSFSLRLQSQLASSTLEYSELRG